VENQLVGHLGYVRRLPVVSLSVSPKKVKITHELVAGEILESLGLVLHLGEIHRLLDYIVVVWSILLLDRCSEELLLIFLNARVDDVSKDLIEECLFTLLPATTWLDLWSLNIEAALVVLVCDLDPLAANT
jgi:hypothetical protein